MNFDYLAWVPCLTGRLFLSHISCGLGTRRILAQVNHIDRGESGDTERYLLLSSEVDWQDTPGKEHDGQFIVILAATSPIESLCLRGYVLLAPKSAIVEYEEWPDIEKNITNIDEKVKKGRGISDDFHNLYKSLSSFSHDEINKVYFSMGVDGLVSLVYIQEKDHQNDEIHTETCVRQAFYYLKYSVHKHQHHHVSDDSITTIHPVKDELNVGMPLLEDLKRALVKLKRNYENVDHSALSEAQGVTAYALSLAETLKSRGLLKQEEYEREVSYFNNTMHSLDSTAQRIERDIERNVAASGHARAIILLVLAILGPLAMLYKDNIVTSDVDDSGRTGPYIIVSLLSNILSSDKVFALFVATLVFVYWVYRAVHSKFGTFILAFRRLRYLMESIVHSPRKSGIISIMVLALGVFLIAIAWMIALGETG